MIRIRLKYHGRALHGTINFKIDLERSFYTFLLILSLLMYCYIFVKFDLISSGNLRKIWGGMRVAKVTHHIKSNPLLMTNSKAAIATEIEKPKPKSAIQQHTKPKLALKSFTKSVKAAEPKKSVKSQNYYVQTSQCKIPYINPFTKPILKLFRPIKYENCTRSIPLYTSTYKEKLKSYVLQLNKNLAVEYFPQIAKTKLKDLQCLFREIKWSENVDSYKLLELKILPEEFIVPRDIDSIIVNCALRSTNLIVYTDAFTFVQYKDMFDKKKPGVLLIGIDSLSRINLRRVMPKTYEYLTSTWFELQGYNKVADNTFPNLMPILTGYNLTATLAKCQPGIVGGMDSRECNIVWDTFKKFGYRTAYAEDMPDISTFNYERKGFKKQPTDYYSRPWMKAMEKYLNVKKRHTIPFCIGYKHAGDYIYDYAHQLAKVYEGKNIFGLFWTNTFSYQSYDDPSMIDDKMVKYFKSFEKDGILDSTIVIFLSARGSYQGKLLELPERSYEQRLPTFFISLPKSFKQNHPDFVKALQVNRNRLTSPYDIHMTLNHILELYEPKLKLPRANGCKKCQSIFHTIPENRTCLDAGITDHWCICSQYRGVYNESRSSKIYITEVIHKMNSYLKTNSFTTQCAEMELHRIRTVNVKVENLKVNKKATYRIKFEVLPFKEVFEATFTIDPITRRVAMILEDIRRETEKSTLNCLTKSTNREIANILCVCRKQKD